MKAATIILVCLACVLGAIAPARAQTDQRIDLRAQARQFVSPTGNGENVPATRVDIGDQFYIEAIATPVITPTETYTISIEYDGARLEWYSMTVGGEIFNETVNGTRKTMTITSYNWLLATNVDRLRLQMHYNVLPSNDRSRLRFTVRTKDRTRNLTVSYVGEAFLQYMPLVRHKG